MKYINTDVMHVIKSWCNRPEDGAIERAKNVASPTRDTGFHLGILIK